MFIAPTALAAGVTVDGNAASKTGYTATFSYEDTRALSVKIMGGFTFYRSNDIYVISAGKLNLDGGIVDPAYLYTPETWEPGLFRFGDAGYVADMTKDEAAGVWSITVDLPCGSYLYQFVVTDADGSEMIIADPANIPAVNALGAGQTRSQFYVPFDAEKQAVSDDWTFVMPLEDESARGTLLWTEYEGVLYEGAEFAAQQMMIYLPGGIRRPRRAL